MFGVFKANRFRNADVEIEAQRPSANKMILWPRRWLETQTILCISYATNSVLWYTTKSTLSHYTLFRNYSSILILKAKNFKRERKIINIPITYTKRKLNYLHSFEHSIKVFYRSQVVSHPNRKFHLESTRNLAKAC